MAEIKYLRKQNDPYVFPATTELLKRLGKDLFACDSKGNITPPEATEPEQAPPPPAAPVEAPNVTESVPSAPNADEAKPKGKPGRRAKG